MLRKYRAYLLLKVAIVLFAAYLVLLSNGKFESETKKLEQAEAARARDVADISANGAKLVDAGVKAGQAAVARVQAEPAAAAASAVPNTTEQACKVPQLDIDDPSIAEFYKVDPAPLECDKVEANWVITQDQKFVITTNAAQSHGKITCNYKPFWRIRADTSEEMKQEKYKDFQNGSTLMTDFFQTVCSGDDGAFFRNTYATVVPDEATLKRLSAAEKPKHWAGLNVLVYGFDSLSRLTFMRKLKKTYEYMTKKEAAVLKGYNIVGDGTPQAFIPILTGSTEPELPLTRKRYKEANYVDVYPFIWKNFSAAGYATQYGEDAAKIGTFTYRLKGFNQQPTDHYFRPFWQKVEMEERQHHKAYCLGSDSEQVLFWRYARDFVLNYPMDVPKLSVMHISHLTHDDLNQPALIDADFVHHLEVLDKLGHLNRSLVIIMADHGHRFAKTRATYQGQMEERLPMMAFIAPRWWREGPARQQWANLQANADRLTTPFDMHATLAEMLHWDVNLQPEQPPAEATALPRSLSLWHPVPMSRTCAQAGIEKHWCTCLNWIAVPVDDAEVQKLAAALVQTINDYTLSERSLCAELHVDKIESARKLVADEKLLKYAKASDADGFVGDFSNNATIDFVTYQLRVRTRPGVALYEATIDYDRRVSHVRVDLAAVSHVNKFGDTPHCIIDANYFLATYCVCYDRIQPKQR